MTKRIAIGERDLPVDLHDARGAHGRCREHQWHPNGTEATLGHLVGGRGCGGPWARTLCPTTATGWALWLNRVRRLVVFISDGGDGGRHRLAQLHSVALGSAGVATHEQL